MAAVAVMALSLCGTVSAVGAAYQQRARVQAVADLSALAAAEDLLRLGSAETACATAEKVAGHNHSRLGRCVHLGGGEIQVQILYDSWFGTVVQDASAGPRRPS